jgi:hypothetical protein
LLFLDFNLQVFTPFNDIGLYFPATQKYNLHGINSQENEGNVLLNILLVRNLYY